MSFRRFVFLLCLVVALPATAPARAQTRKPRPLPIILVHGFAGWGKDEVAGYRYWGGTGLDIERFLNREGFPTATGSVSPVASNHDRACQLFAQIKGGRVDFGEEHAKKFGHARYGRTYTKPLYPWWSEQHPLHFLTHSMGGQTVRVMIDLLHRGHFGPGANARWVFSCVTLSSPHNGTTLTEMSKESPTSWMQVLLGALLERAGSHWPTYDLDLDHWNLPRVANEGWATALRRISGALARTHDFSLWDLHPAGAKEINGRVITHPDVFYVSWANEETFSLPILGNQLPSLVMDPWMIPFATFMGTHRSHHGVMPSQWFKNDGIVNTCSMGAPDGAPRWKSNGRELRRGTFNYMGCIQGKDHLKVVGHYQDPLLTGRWMRAFYRGIARNLYRLSLAPRDAKSVAVEPVPHP